MSNVKHRTKPRWTLSVKSLKRREKHSDVELVQDYLDRFGYLPAGYNRGTFDVATSEAMGVFQRRHSLPVTGDLNESTALLMERPRCGVPNFTHGFLLLSLNSIHSWHVKRNFTYRFVNGTNDIGGNAEQQAIQQVGQAVPDTI
jgi:peptidoglycan hydrolase-like protein with peptidoglycan-binding domain